MRKLLKKDIKLILLMGDVLDYKLWDSKEGNKEAQKLINKYHNIEGNQGFMADVIDLQEKLEEVIEFLE